MKSFFRWLRVEMYKFLHSSLLAVHLLLPVLAVFAMNAYYIVSPWEESMKVSVYLQLLSIAYPLIVGVIISMAAEREAQAGTFQMLLGTPCQTWIPHMASFLVLLLAGVLSVVGAVCGFGIVFRLMGNTIFSFVFFFKAALLLFLGSIPLYLLHYLVGYAYGKGACLGLGIVGSLLCALLITGLGDKVWMFLPWGLSIRFATVFTAAEGKFFILPEMVYGICFMAVSGTAMLLIIAGWSKLWEGRKSEEN